MPDEEEEIRAMERIVARRQRQELDRRAFKRLYGRDPTSQELEYPPPAPDDRIVGIRGLDISVRFGKGSVSLARPGTEAPSSTGAKRGAKLKPATQRIRDLWKERGRPTVTSSLCREIAREVFPGETVGKRLFDRIRSAIRRHGA